MKEYNDLIYYKKDLCKAYSENRKNVTEEDAEDLLNCFFGYLEAETKKKDSGYVYEIPCFGNLYRTPTETEETDAYLDKCYYEKTGLFTLDKPSIFKNETKEEVQRRQNNRED